MVVKGTGARVQWPMNDFEKPGVAKAATGRNCCILH